MKSIHQHRMQVYSKKHIGTPYGKFDCWNVVKSFYAEVLDVEIMIAGPETPLGPKDAEPLIRSLKGRFLEIPKDELQFGDILLLNLFGHPVHIGVYLNKTQFLHTQKTVGCCIDRLPRWKNMIEGCYRYVN